MTFRTQQYSRALAGICLLSIVAAFTLACPCRAAGASNESGIFAEANRLASRASYDEAEKLYQQYLSARPQNSMAHHMYGRMLVLQKRYEDALREYRIGLKLKPSDASLLNDIGVTLSINHFQELGARFLNQATQIDRLYPGAFNNLGVVLDSLEAFQQARDSFSRSLEIQPRNANIKQLLVKVESKLANSKTFDYGPSVSWQDIPDSLKKLEIQPKTPVEPEKVSQPVALVPKVQPPSMNQEDQSWLEKTQPLFLELRTTGFTSICLTGSGMVQVGDKSDTADNIGSLDLGSNPKVEIMGDVTVDLAGQGELQLGKSKVTAKVAECVFTVGAEFSELSCYAGEFKASGWDTVTAIRTSSQVELQAENCQAVYAQDDSKIEAGNCEEVTLVGHAQGIINKCKKVIVNDNSSAVARSCEDLTALANARVRAYGCSKIDKLDHAKIEVSDE